LNGAIIDEGQSLKEDGVEHGEGYDEYEQIAELYDHVVPYRNRPDVDFWVEAASESGGPVLEIGCGTGRVLIPTARAGTEVTGLDLSPRMLEVCRNKLQRESAEVQARVRLVEADMRDFALEQRFELVTTPFRPFQHLITVEDQIACLETIGHHLVDGGRLILDIFNPSLEALTREVGQVYGGEPVFTMPDGRRVLRRHKVADRDRANQIVYSELFYLVKHPDGREERLVHAFPMRYLFRFEAEHLLVRCGFEVEELYAGFDKSPYGTNYPGELIFVATKRESR
jgi:SAM-dependent methyltransferase